jgi:hypothetical protein
MFGQILCLIGENGCVLFENKITALPLKEEIIIKKSIEYYNDPEPCMIHRSAIMKYLYIQVDDFLHQKLSEDKKKILWDDLPQNIKDFLKIDHNVRYLILK